VLFDWDARVYRSPGPCDGNVADGRIEDLRIARDGALLRRHVLRLGYEPAFERLFAGVREKTAERAGVWRVCFDASAPRVGDGNN
jgi:hypothetical protein